MRETAVKKLLANFTKKRILTALAIFLFAFALFFLARAAYLEIQAVSPADLASPAPKHRVLHISEPEIVKGIYLTARTAGIYRFDELLDLAKSTELNTLVVDVKDSADGIIFNTQNPFLLKYVGETLFIKDLEKLIGKAHENKIYLIARVFVFQDPAFVKIHPEWAVKNKAGGVWKDYKGVTWLDPACKGVWDYNLALSRELYNRGFDEINFDYIRFPSDGNLSNAVYPCFKGEDKAKTMQAFFEYLNINLQGIPISVDLFGQTCCNKDDINIGQKIISAFYNFDAICQMMYPSHYYTNFDGYKNPAEHPYEVIKYSLDNTFEKINQLIDSASSTVRTIPSRQTHLRPWIQGFDMGAIYTPEMTRKQMKAIYDTPNTGGWLLWNARNVYSENIFLK